MLEKQIMLFWCSTFSRLEQILVEAELTVSFIAKRYHTMMANLLKRVPLKKMEKILTSEAKESKETETKQYCATNGSMH